jgi:molybdopterin converting factor small subunit
MSIMVQVPGSMKKWFNNDSEPRCSGNTIRECLDSLESQYPGVKKKLLDDQGQLNSIVIFVDGDNIFHLNGLDTKVGPDANISMIPLVAGG